MSVSDVELCNIAYEGKLSLVKKTVQENEGLVRQKDKNQRTALHWACSSGQHGVVDFLLNQGASGQVCACMNSCNSILQILEISDQKIMVIIIF